MRSALYYETPADSPSSVRLYLGDCREILPVVAPPSKRVLLLADVPYGVDEKTDRRAVGRGPEIPAAMELGLDVIGIDVEREYLDTAIKHRIEPAIARGKQVDLWAPRPPREEQLEIGVGR